MSIVERRNREKQQVAAAIRCAAWEIVKNEGWQNLSIRKIAGAIEYSVPVISDHFDNKEAILRAFVLEGFQKLNSALKQAVGHHKEPAGQIKAIGKTYWRFSLDNNEYYQVMYGLGMPGCDEVQKTRELMEFSAIVKTPIDQLLENVPNHEQVSITKFKTFWSLLHGLVSIHILDPSQKITANEKVLEDFTDVFIQGIRGEQP